MPVVLSQLLLPVGYGCMGRGRAAEPAGPLRRMQQQLLGLPNRLRGSNHVAPRPISRHGCQQPGPAIPSPVPTPTCDSAPPGPATTGTRNPATPRPPPPRLPAAQGAHTDASAAGSAVLRAPPKTTLRRASVPLRAAGSRCGGKTSTVRPHSLSVQVVLQCPSQHRPAPEMTVARISHKQGEAAPTSASAPSPCAPATAQTAAAAVRRWRTPWRPAAASRPLPLAAAGRQAACRLPMPHRTWRQAHWLALRH
jgi:hypothetical protein